LIEGRCTTPGGIPIGFEEDSDYLGILGKRFVDAAQAVPHGVKKAQDVETFRYITLLFLLRQPDLRLISIWNPTFLNLLLAPLPKWWLALLQDIADGTISPPGPIQSDLKQALLPRLPPDIVGRETWNRFDRMITRRYGPISVCSVAGWTDPRPPMQRNYKPSSPAFSFKARG